jgi:HK97 family phage major capsid protein
MALSEVVREKQERRSRLQREVEGILQGAQGAKRQLSVAEEARCDVLTAELDKIEFTPEERIELAQEEIQMRNRVVKSIQLDGNDFAEPETAALTKEQRMADVVRGEGRNLSIGKYMRGLLTGAWDGAREERDMALGSLTAGGYLVPAPLSTMVIDRARAISRVFQAGALTVPMPSSTYRIARIVNDPTIQWRGEGATINESDVTLGAVDFVAKSAATLVTFSRELAEDAANLDAVVRESIAGALAAELDRVALYGAGTSAEPKGLINQTGLNKISAGTNGGAITFPLMYQAVQSVMNGNHEPENFILAPRTEIAVAQLRDGSLGKTIDDQPIINAIPRLYTTNVPVNRTQGTANDCSDLFCGDWDNLMYGIRTELVIELLRERKADTGEYQALCWFRGDVQVSDIAGFSAVVGINA